MSSQTKAKQIARRGVIASDSSKGRSRRRKKHNKGERTKLLGRKHTPPLKSKKEEKRKTLKTGS
jgi:hypothetical protein